MLSCPEKKKLASIHGQECVCGAVVFSSIHQGDPGGVWPTCVLGIRHKDFDITCGNWLQPLSAMVPEPLESIILDKHPGFIEPFLKARFQV